MRHALPILAFFLVAAAPVSLQPQREAAPVPAFRFERTITPGATGPNRLEIDVALLVGSDPLRYVEQRDVEKRSWNVFSGGLRDLRLYDARGCEVPYLLIPPQPPAPRWQPGSVLPILARKRISSGFEVDLGVIYRVDLLRLGGIPAPFLKKFRLEGSGDRARWILLAEEGTLFDLPEQGLRRTEIGFAPGEFRYFRLTWDDRSSARVAPPGNAEARLPSSFSPAPSLRFPLEIKRLDSEPGKSRFAIDLPGPTFPLVAIELDVADGPVLRPAQVTEAQLTGDGVAAVRLGSAILKRSGQGDLVASDLRIPIDCPREPQLNLVVEDGDNPPLEPTGITAELAPLPWIFFESFDGEPLTARFGAEKMTEPRYDLEAKRNVISGVACAMAAWGRVEEIGAVGERIPLANPLPLAGAQLDPGQFRFSRGIADGKAGLSVLPLDAAVLAHSTIADLRIADVENRQVPYLFETRDEPLVVDVKLPKPVLAKSGTGLTSSYLIDLPFDSLPACQLVLHTPSRIFDRRVTVAAEKPRADARSKPGWEPLAEARWMNVSEERPAPQLVLSLGRPNARRLMLTVDEGDNSPLPIQDARLLLPAYQLRFFLGERTRATLYYGSPQLRRPKYDLTLLASRLLGRVAGSLSLEPETVRGTGRNREIGQNRVFWIVLILAAVILLLLLTRLLMKGNSVPPEG
jgi:hypothetical protein